MQIDIETIINIQLMINKTKNHLKNDLKNHIIANIGRYAPGVYGFRVVIRSGGRFTVRRVNPGTGHFRARIKSSRVLIYTQNRPEKCRLGAILWALFYDNTAPARGGAAWLDYIVNHIDAQNPEPYEQKFLLDLITN